MDSNDHVWFPTDPWIDGNSLRGEATDAVCDPATGQPIAEVTHATPEMVTGAIEGAGKALRPWQARSAFQRGELLKEVASRMRAQRDSLARLLTREQGKPLAQAEAEVEYGASFFQWFGEQARRIGGRIQPHPDASREFQIQMRPIGVAGLITPWNFPLAQGAKKIAAALAAGCTAVWKPSEKTPLIALALGELMHRCGLPPGVVQIVPAPGPRVGNILAEHPLARVLSLTGSTATGRWLMAAAAPQVKRVALELGGNAPFLVLEDANLEEVVEQLVQLKLFVSGQVCVTANRILVDRRIEPRLCKLLQQKLMSRRVGHGLDRAVDAGPLIDPPACQKVQSLVDLAIAEGAELVCQNRTFEEDQRLQQDRFYPPTLLRHVEDAMPIAQQEIFGPVLPLMAFDRIEEAIERANRTPMGLAAYVYGSRIERCQAIARELEVGIVGINEWRPLKAEIPFGGVKQSGIGSEGGEEGLHDYLVPQVISTPKPSIGCNEEIRR